MGLGKTRQAIVSLRHLTPGGPRLVVCPASVKRNWAREIAVVAPDSPVLIIEGSAPVAPTGGMGDRQLRHPRTPHGRLAARALGGAGLRRGALPEEPHQHAQQARAPAHGHRGRGSPGPCRPAPDRNAAHQPSPRSLRAAAAGRSPARPQLSRVREAVLRRRKRRLRMEDRRRVEHRRADGPAARRHAAALEGRGARAAAEAARVDSGRSTAGHRVARHQEGVRAPRRQARTGPRRRATGTEKARPAARVPGRGPPGARVRQDRRPRSTSSEGQSIRDRR